MKQSPTQMLQLFFRWVRIELDESQLPEEPMNPLIAAHWLEGVTIESEFSIALLDDANERGRMYMASLRVQIANEPSADGSGKNFSPYKIDVDARATVLVLKGAETLAPPEDMAAVNGASLIWSAIREQVASVTARMLAGPLVLPSMSFRDLKPSERTASVVEQPDNPIEAIDVPREKRRRKPVKTRQ